MKKFMKACVIIALILLIVGVVMAFVGSSAEGTDKVSELVESVTGGKIQLELGNGSWGIFSGEDDWEAPGALFDIDDNTMFDKDYETLENNVEKYAVGTGVSKLDIEVGGCAFYFEESGDNQFYVEAKNAGKFQCFIKGDTLYVKSSRTTVDDWSEITEGEIRLYIPANYTFEEMDVELGAGLLQMQKANATDMELNVGAGRIVIGELLAGKCSAEVGMGEIMVENMTVSDVEAEVGMGNLKMAGTIQGNVDAECSMGAITFTLTGKEEAFNYNLEAAMGNISLNGTEYSGMTQDKTIQNGASKHMNIECSMGNIEIDFAE